MILFPISAFLVSLACAAVVAVDARRRPKPDKVAWTIAFGLFAIAAGFEVGGALAGWNPLLVRIYYLTGATLVVGFLGLGQLYLLAGPRIAGIAPGAALLVTALAITVIWDAPVDKARLAGEGWHALVRGPALVATTVSINILGTVVVIGGALWSAFRFWRRGIARHRMIGCLLIAIGTLVVASGGSLTRLGSPQYFDIAMALGVGIIFAGYLQARRPGTMATEAARSLERPINAAVSDPPGGAMVRPPIPLKAIGGRRSRATPNELSPGTALIASWIEQLDAATIAYLCEEWSAPADPAPVLTRQEARRVWSLRLCIPAARHPAFDQLPVPVRRQLAVVADDVFGGPDRAPDRRATG